MNDRNDVLFHFYIKLNLPSNFISQRFCWNNCDFFTNSLVCMEVHCQSSVILLNDDLSGLFDGFCSNSTLKRTINILIKLTNISEQKLLFIVCRHKIFFNRTFLTDFWTFSRQTWWNSNWNCLDQWKYVVWMLILWWMKRIFQDFICKIHKTHHDWLRR